MLKLQLTLLLLLFSAFSVVCCMASTCHQFQYKHTPGTFCYSNSNNLNNDYCNNANSDVCCSNGAVVNYNLFINKIVIDSESNAGLNCQQLSRELMCHYGCSPNLNVTFNIKVYRFQPQFTQRFIQQFMSECRNSMWCGTQDNHTYNSSHNNICYIVRRGYIMNNENTNISHLKMSVVEFVNQVLDAGIGGSRNQDPPELLPIIHEEIIVVEIIKNVKYIDIFAFCVTIFSMFVFIAIHTMPLKQSTDQYIITTVFVIMVWYIIYLYKFN